MENLRALVYGKDLNLYQRKLAQQEFEKLETSWRGANRFIIDIAEELRMDTDSVGFDGISFSIDDFKMAIENIPQNNTNDLKQALENIKAYIEIGLDRADPTMAMKSALTIVEKALSNAL